MAICWILWFGYIDHVLRIIFGFSQWAIKLGVKSHNI